MSKPEKIDELLDQVTEETAERRRKSLRETVDELNRLKEDADRKEQSSNRELPPAA